MKCQNYRSFRVGLFKNLKTEITNSCETNKENQFEDEKILLVSSNIQFDNRVLRLRGECSRGFDETQ